MASYEESKFVTEKTEELSQLYPKEATYSSRCTLWRCGLTDNVVTDEEYDLAKNYYGRQWNYVGD